MKKLEDLYSYIKANGCKDFKPVVDVDVNYLYLKDNKGTRIFYEDEDDSFKVKCRVKTIKNDNTITFLEEPFYMDLYAKDNRDVLSILKSKI